jgi:hypothetical protein
MHVAAIGRVPGNVADGDVGPPPSQNFAEPATLSEELWAREQVGYRARNEPGQRG